MSKGITILGVAICVMAALANQSACGADVKLTRPAISAEACPVEIVSAPTSDGQKATIALRKPPVQGPFPAMIHLHGGLSALPVDRLKQELLNGQTHCRFLAAGYVVVNPTFRSREQDPQTRDALVDCLGIIDYVKKTPEVDPQSVVLWGDSGGGSLALELAGETPLCAIAAQEPATVLFTGVFNNETLGKPGNPQYRKNWNGIMQDPQRYYTPELRKFTEEKIRKINCPVFIAHGDKHAINKINNEIFVPALKAAGKQVEVILYPGENHGFSHRGTPAMTKKFFDDCDAFFRRHLPTQPRPLARTLVSQVPVE
jgi:acetyl esterase/lipase